MNAEECPAGSSSAYDYQQYQGLQPELFFKMSHEIYNYGEGIIGKVAADHSHKWIYKEPNDQEINFLSAWHNSADSHPRTWEAQFQSGIKTIALIAVREGVIQLGAINKVIEDLSYVVLLRKKFSYIESIPGVLLPHPSSAAYPMKIDGYALSPEAWPPHFPANIITPSMSSLEALLSKLPSVVPTGPSMAVPGNYSDVPQPYMDLQICLSFWRVWALGNYDSRSEVLRADLKLNRSPKSPLHKAFNVPYIENREGTCQDSGMLATSLTCTWYVRSEAMLIRPCARK
nr:protein RICE SALT SENSITIVE 3-like [Ipomoea batatas]GME13627.1 protein RICE SALT SENSITIVE 3-like [Ipomoea batatas]